MRRLFRFVILFGFVGAVVTALKRRLAPPPLSDQAPAYTPPVPPAEAPAPPPSRPAETPAATTAPEPDAPDKIDLLTTTPPPEQLPPAEEPSEEQTNPSS